MKPLENRPVERLGKTRVQVDLSPIEVDRMNWMMEVCGLESRKDLFNTALTLLEWAANEAVEGRKVASFNDQSGDRYVLGMPALQNAARSVVKDKLYATS